MYADVEKHRKMATTKAMTKRNNNFEVHSIRLARKLLVNQFNQCSLYGHDTAVPHMIF